MAKSSIVVRILVGAVVVIAAVAVGGFALAWRSAIEPVGPPSPSSFDAALVRQGAELAALGDCNTCHTAPGGKAFAGGLALQTPFGAIYSTNITPDPETGIGRWSLAAFQRAMRDGVDRTGNHLYPAFPYDHFTLVTDDDNKALYAYLMTRRPVEAHAPANQLPFPINIRLVLEGWKMLFLKQGPYVPDPAHDAVWNRGAYLVEGLGHCGACHTPRNLFGAEDKNQRFAGNDIDGWHAYAINASSPAPVPWTEDALHSYLGTGLHAYHGVARGPMAPVPVNLATVPDDDVRAIAVYIASLIGAPSPERRQKGDALVATLDTKGTGSKPQSGGTQTLAPQLAAAANDMGAAIYAGTCAACHESGRPVPYGAIRLSLSSAVTSANPSNLINIVLGGLPAPDGSRGPIMPGFAAALSDQQIAELVKYLRSRDGDLPVWSDVETTIRDARAANTTAASLPVSASQ